MKKYIVKFLLGVVMLTGIASCKKNNVVIDQDPLIAPEAARILKSNAVFDNFYIQNTSGGGGFYKLPIGITNVSEQERKIQFTYQSRSAINGTQYTAPSTLTIPAGKTVDTLTIQGLFNGYATPGRKDTLVIKIVKGDGFVKPNAYNDSIVVVLQKYCDVVLNELEGLYENTNEYSTAGAFSYGPYTTYATDFEPINATSAKVKLGNLYDDGWNDIEATIDWTSPANFTVTINKQLTGRTSGGFPVYVRTTSGRTNTFSSCDQTISLFIDRLGGADGTTVLTSAYQIRLVR